MSCAFLYCKLLLKICVVLRMCFAIMSVAINWNSVIPSRNDEAFLTVSLVNSEECSAMYVSVLTSGV